MGAAVEERPTLLAVQSTFFKYAGPQSTSGRRMVALEKGTAEARRIAGRPPRGNHLSNGLLVRRTILVIPTTIHWYLPIILSPCDRWPSFRLRRSARIGIRETLPDARCSANASIEQHVRSSYRRNLSLCVQACGTTTVSPPSNFNACASC